MHTHTHPPSDTPSFMTETTKWKHLPETKQRKRLIWYLPREFFVMRNHNAHIHLSAHWQSIALRDHLSSNHSFCPLRRFMQKSNWLSRMQFDATSNTPECECISRCILHFGESCYWCCSLLCHFLPFFLSLFDREKIYSPIIFHSVIKKMSQKRMRIACAPPSRRMQTHLCLMFVPRFFLLSHTNLSSIFFCLFCLHVPQRFWHFDTCCRFVHYSWVDELAISASRTAADRRRRE